MQLFASELRLTNSCTKVCPVKALKCSAYARLHTSERFLEQMRLARQEFRVKMGLATIVEMKAYKKAAEKRAKAKKIALK